MGQRGAAWLAPSSASGGARRALAAPLLAGSLRNASFLVRATEPGEGVATTASASAVRASGVPPPPTVSTSAAPLPIRLTLETREARQTLRFSEVWDGEAPAIVVTAVASSSTAAEFGVVAGSRLLALPHPTRKGERWELRPGSAPLSRVRDLIRVYRGVLIDMEFSSEPIPDEAIEAWVREQEEKRERKEGGGGAEGPSTSSSPSSPSPSAAAASDPSTTLMTSSYDSDDSGSRAYSPAAAAAEREARALERRLRLRAERLAIDDARDDTKVVVWASVAFLLPAAVILAIAYFSGYLDSMQANLT